jgi:PIN domain nuclease of toxin-antitoxin system
VVTGVIFVDNLTTFETLNLIADDAASFHHLPRTPHRDPFDRMLIWQALREKMILISKDTKLPANQRFGLSILDG